MDGEILNDILHSSLYFSVPLITFFYNEYVSVEKAIISKLAMRLAEGRLDIHMQKNEAEPSTSHCIQKLTQNG